ncbi:PREDICTED: tetraspanin-2 [Tarenaya hassleriana]|uniref:tetraspanin-2 n=1 Tax=Tarenaya hassleriana TaxID=28532 RepID=UPI00053C7ACD|nr:PREDICTED: tetraspanin-2 [Tarenaya hassleriana]
MAVANNLTAILNFIALLCSIPITASGIWLASKPDNECVHLLRWPIVTLGVLILVVSAAGFIGAYWYKETLLAVYLCCMAILIGLLLVVLIFAFVVTRPDGSYPVPGRAYKEYRLEEFSNWLRDNVVDSKNWIKIRACLADTDVCPKLSQEYITADQFFSSPDITPLQSGCCKPPTACGYSFVNPTVWQNPTNMAADGDCYIWNNDQSQLCYNCNSCKGGLLGNLRREWRKANVILIVTVVVLIWVYLIACSAFRNAQTEDLFRRYKQGWV